MAVMQELLRLHRSFDRHLGQMQGGILEVRMVPLGQAFEKLGTSYVECPTMYHDTVALAELVRTVPLSEQLS